MKSILRKGGLVTVILSLLLAIGLALSPFEAPRSYLRSAASPAQSALAAAIHWMQNWRQHFSDYDTLAAENQALRSRIAELEQEALRGEDALRENRRLRSLLRLSAKQPELTFLDAVVIARSTSNWEDDLTLNQGSEDGAAIGNCVTDPYGNLVGIVTEVGPHWSRLSTVIDPHTALGARLPRTDDYAVAQGSFEGMTGGYLTLTYLPTSSSIMVGDRVVTSGLGENYPADLTLGIVTDIQTEPDGISRTATVAPCVDVAHLRYVYIVTD